MTQTTDQERAEFGANSKAEFVIEVRNLKRRIRELKTELQAARRAQVVPTLDVDAKVQEVMRLVQYNLDHMTVKSFEDIADKVKEFLAAAPQPPKGTVNDSLTVEAAPVQMPEPVGVLRVFEPHEGAQEVCTEATINAVHLQHGWYTLHAVRAHKNTQQEQHHGA